MTEYKLSHAEKFDQISLRLKDSEILREVVRSYLYKDSDDKGIYVYAFLSDKAISSFEDILATSNKPLADDYEDLVERHTCSYFFPWSQVVYLQLN